MKYTEQEALEKLTELSRCSIFPKMAKDLAKAFKCKLDDSLIINHEQPREIIRDPFKSRVNVCDLAESICKQLDIEPDKKLMDLSYKFNGIGRIVETKTEACCVALKKRLPKTRLCCFCDSITEYIEELDEKGNSVFTCLKCNPNYNKKMVIK